MTTKEKIVTKCINRLDIEKEKIDSILNANPLSSIIELRREAADFIKKLKELEPPFSQEVIEKINQLAKEEKKQFKIAEKQQTGVKLIKRKVKIDMELSDLHRELYFIELKTANRLKRLACSVRGDKIIMKELKNDRPLMTSNFDKERCPQCGLIEIDAMTPRTVYECGSSDYDQRPGTFKESENCKK